LYIFAVWRFAKNYAADAAAIISASGTKKRDERTRAIRTDLRGTLIRKEWRLLTRDPLLLSQISLQLVYIFPLFFVIYRTANQGNGQVGIASIAGIFVLLASSLSANLAWLTVSAEDAPDLMAAAPVSRDQIDFAKAAAAGLPVAALMTLPAI